MEHGISAMEMRLHNIALYKFPILFYSILWKWETRRNSCGVVMCQKNWL